MKCQDRPGVVKTDSMNRPTGSVWEKGFKVIRILREAGHVAYFAGGCVRDKLLGLQAEDVDVATDAPPQRVRELFKNTRAVGQMFGVILVRFGRDQIEVATFRSDGIYKDGRRPETVRFASAEEDARRRDFTINGLFYDPISDHVIDYVGGLKDLEARILRAIGDPKQRFEEDHLRMLRAVRFAARFDLTIDPATSETICQDAPLITRISGERVAEELRRMLPPSTRSKAFHLLWEHRLLEPLTGIACPVKSLLTERSLTLSLPAEPVRFPIGLMCLVIDTRWQGGGARQDLLGNFSSTEISGLVSGLRQKLKLSNEECDEMTGTAGLVHRLLQTRSWTVAATKRACADRYADSARIVLQALLKAGFAPDRVQQALEKLRSYSPADCAPPPILTGDHLVAAGYAPGPDFKRVLDQVYDAQLENRIHTSEQALELAHRLLAKASGF